MFDDVGNQAAVFKVISSQRWAVFGVERLDGFEAVLGLVDEFAAASCGPRLCDDMPAALE